MKKYTPVSDYLCQEYDPLTALVYGKVHRYTEWGGECSASLDRIARELGMNERTVRRKLKILEIDGFIQLTKPGIGVPSVWIPTKKLENISDNVDTEPRTESPNVDTTPDRESEHPGQRVHTTPDRESDEESFKETYEENIINDFSVLSSAFWNLSGIPIPSFGGRGWSDWEDGINELLKINATPEEMKDAKVIIDESDKYTCTRPGALVKTIINSRNKKNRKKETQSVGGQLVE